MKVTVRTHSNPFGSCVVCKAPFKSRAERFTTGGDHSRIPRDFEPAVHQNCHPDPHADNTWDDLGPDFFLD